MACVCACAGLPSFSYEQFLWAVAAVMSRQNSIPSKQGGGGGGRGDVLALIPGYSSFLVCCSGAISHYPRTASPYLQVGHVQRQERCVLRFVDFPLAHAGSIGSIATFFDVTKDENQSSTMEVGFACVLHLRLLTPSVVSAILQDVKKGDQIYIYYGQLLSLCSLSCADMRECGVAHARTGERPNSKLFIFSGFVTSDNTVDSYQFML